MNWKFIFGLSLFGLAMAFLTISVIPMKVENICWLAILLICAYIIAKYAPGKYFMHGFLVCLLNCVWITGAHVIFATTYLANHADEAAQYANMNQQMHVTPAQAMLITGPVIGIISGLVLGVFSFLASRLIKKNRAAEMSVRP